MTFTPPAPPDAPRGDGDDRPDRRARHRVDSLVLGSAADLDAAKRLSGPHGWWAACREAARAGDLSYLTQLAASNGAQLLDDGLPASRGVLPSSRANALVAAARLAVSERGDGAEQIAELRAIARAFTPPGSEPWNPEALPDPHLGGGSGSVAELVTTLERRRPHPGLAVAADLLADVAAVPGGASTEVRVPLAHNRGAGMARLTMRVVAGRPSLLLDAVAAPFLRWDEAFEDALQTAWWAAGAPSLAVRWSLTWERTGEPVDVVGGASIGLAAAVAVHALAHPGSVRVDARAAITGAIAASGDVLTLLGRDGELTPAYCDKLADAADTLIVLPAADHVAVAAYLDRTTSSAPLEPVGHLSELVRAAGPAAGDNGDVCPYQGLSPFDTSDADRFFGRERLVAELARRLAASTLVGVVGSSGAGKSSLVRAGLLPALARDAVPGSSHWATAVLAPGSDPWGRLRSVLADALDVDPEQLWSSSGTEPLPETVVTAVVDRVDADRPLFLVVDQLEELFTFAPERAGGLLTTLAALAGAGPDIRVLVIVRADFYGHATRSPDFAQAMANNHVLVGAMTPSELRRVIEAPARRVGLRTELALVEAVLDDVVDQPGALPHLSVALAETWTRRAGSTLTLSGYLASGGVGHALARLADEFVSSCDEAERTELRNLFTRLVAVSDAGPAVRRPAGLDELTPRQAALVPALVPRRLLLVDGDTVQLVHDALVVAWPTLVGWLAEDRDELRLQLELTEHTHDWETAGEDVDALARGARLARFEELAARRPDALNEAEHRFIAQGRAAENATLDHERRVARRTRRLLMAASVAFVIALVGGLVAVAQWNQAERARSAEAAGEKAARAQAALQGDSRARAALLSLAALEASPNFEASAGLGAALSSFERPVDTLQIHADDVIFGAMSTDGRFLSTGSWDHTARVWDALTMAPIVNLRGATTATSTVVIAPDNMAVAMVACHAQALDECDPVMRIWALPDGSALAEVSTGRRNRSITWLGPDRVAIAHPDGVSVWNRRGEPLADLPTSTLGISGGLTSIVAVNSSTVAVGSDAGEVRWLELPADGTPGAPQQAVVPAEVSSLALSPDGSLLAVGDMEGGVSLLDTATATPRFAATSQFESLTRAQGEASLGISKGNPVLAMAFSADSTRLLAGGGRNPVRQGGDDDLRMWSVADGRLVRRFTGISEPLRGVGFRADGRITAVSVERRARVFEQNPSGLVLERAVQQQCDDEGGDVWWLGSTKRCWATASAFLPDSRHTLVTGWDKTIALYDAGTGEVLRSEREPGATTKTPYWNWPKRLDVTRDGSLVADPTDEGGVQLWRLDGNGLTPTVHLPGRLDAEGDPVMVNNLAFDPTGTRLAVAEEDGGVAMWELATGTELWRGGHGPPSWNIATFANDVDWNPEGTRLVSAGGDARLRLWDGATGRQLGVTDENSYVQNVSQWSPDGQTIFSAGSDGVMRVWSADLTLRREFHLGVTAVVDADFTTDGSLVAVADQAYVVRVIDPTSGRQLASFPLSHEPTSVDFSPDGRSIVATDKQGTLTTFAGPALWVDTACRLAGRNLTQNEWDGFAGSERSYRRLCPQLPVGAGAPSDAPAATGLADALVAAVS